MVKFSSTESFDRESFDTDKQGETTTRTAGMGHEVLRPRRW